jgi:hypothetical protein
VKQAGGLRFDVHPVGEIVFSSASGYRRVSQVVNRVLAASPNEDARNALEGRLPELRLDNATLLDAVDVLRDATKIDIRADWNELSACGLTPKTPVHTRLYNVPLALALGIMIEGAPGTPPVDWEIGDGKIVARAARR